jgi:seryl-tRNA synthetase
MSDEDLQAQIDELKSKNKRLSDDLKAARDSAKDADSLKARVSELTEQMSAKDAELKETRAEARDRRLELRKVETERDEIAGRVEALTTERDTLATRLETEPNEYKQKFEQVAADLRNTKHQVAYRKVADSFKVDTENLTKYNDFLKTVNYTPETDDPDEERISAVFQDALKDRPWYVKADPAPTTTYDASATRQGNGNGHTNGTAAVAAKPPTQPAKPGPGADRGSSLATTQVGTAPARIPGKL